MLSGPASLVFPMTHTSGPRLRFLLKTTLVEGKLLATRAPYGKIRSYAICKKFPHALLCILVVGGFPCLLWGFIGADWFGDSILTCEPEILFFHSVISFSLSLHQGVCLISQSTGSLHLLWANLKCQMKRCQLGCSGPPRSFRSPSESQPKHFFAPIFFLSSLILASYIFFVLTDPSSCWVTRWTVSSRTSESPDPTSATIRGSTSCPGAAPILSIFETDQLIDNS